MDLPAAVSRTGAVGAPQDSVHPELQDTVVEDPHDLLEGKAVAVHDSGMSLLLEEEGLWVAPQHPVEAE